MENKYKTADARAFEFGDDRFIFEFGNGGRIIRTTSWRKVADYLSDPRTQKFHQITVHDCPNKKQYKPTKKNWSSFLDEIRRLDQKQRMVRTTLIVGLGAIGGLVFGVILVVLTN